MQPSPPGIQNLLLTHNITTFQVWYLLAPTGNIYRSWKTSRLQEPPFCITKDISTELHLCLHCISQASKHDFSALASGTVIPHLMSTTGVWGCFRFRKLQISLKALCIGGKYLFIYLFILNFITTRQGNKDEKKQLIYFLRFCLEFFLKPYTTAGLVTCSLPPTQY